MPLDPSVPLAFPLLPTDSDGVPVVHFYNETARLEPLPMERSIDLSAWEPFVDRWRDPNEDLTASLNHFPRREQLRTLFEHLRAFLRAKNDHPLPTLTLNDALRLAVEPLDENNHHTGPMMRQEIAVAMLLDLGAQPLVDDLVRAARGGNPRLVQRLIQACPSLLDQPEVKGDAPALSDSPLLVVCSRNEHSGYAQIAQILLSAGMSPDHKDKVQRRSAVHWATAGNNPAVLQVLLNNGANPNVLNRRQQPPLHYAAARNNPSTLRLLIEHGADPLVNVAPRASSDIPPLLGFETPQLGRPSLGAELKLDRAGQAPLAPYRDTPLLQAAAAGANLTLELLLDYGEEPCPLLNPEKPDGPRDERIVRLVEDACIRAVSEGDACVRAAEACAVMLERHRLRQMFKDTPELDVTPDARTRARL